MAQFFASTQTVSYGIQLRVPISLPGVSIAEIENGRITYWSDYDDERTSRRVTLASFFTRLDRTLTVGSGGIPTLSYSSSMRVLGTINQGAS